VFSAYELRDGTRIWIITEADRSITTICFSPYGHHDVGDFLIADSISLLVCQ
jgi:hypothetical protein